MVTDWDEVRGPGDAVGNDVLEAVRRSSVRAAVRRVPGNGTFILAYAALDLLGHLVDAAGTFSLFLNLPPEEVFAALKERETPVSIVLLGVGRGCETAAHIFDIVNVFDGDHEIRAVVLVGPEADTFRVRCILCSGKTTVPTGMGDGKHERCPHCLGAGSFLSMGSLEWVVRLAAEHETRPPSDAAKLPRLVVTSYPSVAHDEERPKDVADARAVADAIFGAKPRQMDSWVDRRIDYESKAMHDRHAIDTALSIVLGP